MQLKNKQVYVGKGSMGLQTFGACRRARKPTRIKKVKSGYKKRR